MIWDMLLNALQTLLARYAQGVYYSIYYKHQNWCPALRVPVLPANAPRPGRVSNCIIGMRALRERQREVCRSICMRLNGNAALCACIWKKNVYGSVVGGFRWAKTTVCVVVVVVVVTNNHHPQKPGAARNTNIYAPPHILSCPLARALNALLLRIRGLVER